MSKYTTEIRFICETLAGVTPDSTYKSPQTVISEVWNQFFDFDFPIFDESYRSVLCQKILKHYYTREIGAETFGLFKLWLDTRLNEIMPYYNQLYKTQLLDFNPFYDVDLTRTHEGKSSGNENGTTSGEESGKSTFNNSGRSASETSTDSTNDTTSTSSGTNGNTNIRLYSDTPQGALTGVESETYLTDATKTMDNGTTSNSDHTTQTGNVNGTASTTDSRTGQTTDSKTSSGTSTKALSSTDEWIETVKGKQGTQSYASLLKEFRETFLNIDAMILDELADLFLNLW